MNRFQEKILEDSNIALNVCDKYKSLIVEDIVKVQKSVSLPYSVGLLSLTGELNIGTSIRSACIFGAKKVIIFGRRRYDKRSTVGASNYIEVERHFALNKDMEFDTNVVIDYIESNNIYPIFIEQGGINLSAIDWNWELDRANDCGKELVIFFGSEGDGIPTSLLKHFGRIVSIEQLGVLRSLNVSSAASIVCYDVYRNLLK